MERTQPALELHFRYISRERRKRCYIMLDDKPQEALQVRRYDLINQLLRFTVIKLTWVKLNWCFTIILWLKYQFYYR